MDDGLLQSKDDPLLQWCQEIVTALPNADICIHYSLKWNYSQNADASYRKFSKFCAALQQYKHASVLLVSGGGKKRKLDTVQVRSKICTEST